MSAIARFGDRAALLARRVIPDPFVIAVGLSALVLAIAAARTGTVDAFKAYTRGMFDGGLLAFAFKMALILVTGHALAAAPVTRRLLGRLAALPRTTPAAAALVALTALLLGLLNWGLGLVAGAFAAREVGRAFHARGQPLNYPLIGAAGYLGLVVWHGGLSGSAPLKVADAGPFGDPLPISETVLGPMNLVVTGLVLTALPLLFRALGRSGDVSLEPWEATLAQQPEASDAPGPLDRIERSPLITAVLVVPVVVTLGAGLLEKGAAAINLDFVILAFFALGLLLHGRPLAYANAFGEGARGAAGILLQFPIYFGILAAAKASGVLVDIASAMNTVAASMGVDAGVSAPLMTFTTAAGINMLVPSGGGQWVLQQPIITAAVDALHVSRAEMVMAFAYGDQLTNMLQPFWALPLLSITGLKAREVMGYTILAMLAAIPCFALGLILF
jgi:short-chain fatty acids transporter